MNRPRVDVRALATRPWLRWSGAAIVVTFGLASLTVGTIRTPGWDSFWTVAEFAAAVAAAAAAVRTAARSTGQRRPAWGWIGAAMGSWALGEAWWMGQESLLGLPMGVPSPADVGFLLMPVFAAVGLLLHPATRALRMGQRIRVFLDAGTTTVAVLLFAWQFTIVPVHDPSVGYLAEAVTLAYPLSDVVLVAILCIVLTHSTVGRRQAHLVWLLAGLLALAGADSVFSYLASNGSLSSVSVADLLWTVGFSAIAVAAVSEPGGSDDESVAASPDREWLPFALLAGSALILVGRWLAGASLDRVTVALVVTVGVLGYIRQYLLLREKRQLEAQIDDGHERLRLTGLHDPLTGLLNPAGLRRLVDEALDRPDVETLTLVKLGPTYPHLLDNLASDEADAVLSNLSERIRGCLRPGDHLARMSELTFEALVLGGSEAGIQFAQRVMLATEAPVTTGDRRLHVGLCAGVAATSADESDVSGVILAQRAAIALNSVAGLPGGIATFAPSMLRAQVDHLEVRESVVAALRSDAASGLEVLYEPIVRMATGQLAGVSARAGLRDHRYTTITAGRLVALAREAGMAERVDEAVLIAAIGHFSAWSKRWPGACEKLWIGICGETLAASGFAGQLEELLRDAGVPAQSLVLEPLDGAGGRASRDAAGRTLLLLREQGVQVVASDSMAMSGYPAGPDAADEVAAEYYDVSPALVGRCVADLRARRLVQATAEFAASHHAEAAARQVVTIEQHEELFQAGCALARGPLYGPSLPKDAADDVLAAVAGGTWQTPAGQSARRHRSSRAWQELRTVISRLPIAAFACDLDGRLVLAEGGLIDVLGITDDLLDQVPVDLFRPGWVEDQLTAGLRTALAGTSSVTTVRMRERFLQVHLSPAVDHQGVVTGALGVSFDVTLRVQAEDAMRRSEQQFKSVFAQAPVGMAIVTAEGRLKEVNPALAAMLGYTPEELTGRTLTSMWHSETPEGAANQYTAAGTGAIESYHAEHAYKHRDGSAVWARVTVGPMADDQAPGSVIGIVEDLRAYKKLEVELRHAQKLEAVGMLAAGIAHEINTPTQFIGDNLNFLSDAFTQFASALEAAGRLCRPADEVAAAELDLVNAGIDLPWLLEEVPAAVSQSLAGVTRVATIVGAMRNFGHPDGEQPSPVDVDAAIRDTATVALNEYKYVADLILELGGAPPVSGYPSQFHQVMLNLIVNAAHAIGDDVGDSGRRGTIRVRSWAADGWVHVSVSDDGCGMPAQTRSRIFDPFFTTKPIGRGTGQGLTIVHHVVVDRHHGTIDVDSTPGQGTEFTLHLPMAVTGSSEPDEAHEWEPLLAPDPAIR